MSTVNNVLTEGIITTSLELLAARNIAKASGDTKTVNEVANLIADFFFEKAIEDETDCVAVNAISGLIRIREVYRECNDTDGVTRINNHLVDFFFTENSDIEGTLRILAGQ